MTKHKSRATRLGDAISKIEEGKGIIEDLQAEIDEWKSGMEGTNLEFTQKYQDLENCLSELQDLIDSLDDSVSNSESIEFPTMF